MGVPKFYRWISERYPCLSTVAREYQLPEFDNLYLDMNGIIHVCSHPNDTDAHFRITEEEIFKNIFDYIDFIFRMVKPKKCFFMAVDGVAPRAKMNQQRDRRFRSAKEAEESEKAARSKGEELPTEKRFDSNCISPGTEFMERLHEQLKYFVVQKLSTDPVWQKEGLKIYLSGHDAPGEGEHKAMDFIRYLRSQDDYDPNTRHCIYGQDADLIMLALCTHEPHIALLREEVVFGRQATKRVQSADKVTFHLLHINLLREYLDHEFAELKKPGVLQMKYNIENIIDDWLLMCFLVGNDFLPHLPNLHIAHDALPILHKTYCAVMPTLDGYLHEQGKLNLKNFEVFMTKLGERDLEMFEKIEEKHPDGMEELGEDEMDEVRKKFPNLDIPDAEDSDEDIWEGEFRQHKRHYYMTKMGYPEVTDAVLREQAEGYIRAVQWNLHYYYNGVQSWSWYYPHHYSPYISDIKNFGKLKVNFELGKPFLPFQQLVSIMPAASRELVPQAYRGLMTEEESPLREYFPDDFETDLNGKTQDWEAVVLIKYIEEDILLNSMKKYDNLLTDTEKMRNKHGNHLVYEFSSKALGSYESPQPGHKWFPTIVNNHAKCSELPSDTFRIHPSTIKKGRLPNTQDSVFYPGFPSLRHLPHKAELSLQGCRVFTHASRSYNMILSLDEIPADLESHATLVGKIIHINYPHLRQAIVTKVSNEHFVVAHDGKKKLSEIETKEFPKKVDGLQTESKYRWGINTGDCQKLLIHCRPLIGRKYIYQGDNQVTIEKQWNDVDTMVLHNTIISDLQEHEVQVSQFKTLKEIFSNTKTVFMMTENDYGLQGRVNGHLPGGNILIESKFREEPDFSDVRRHEAELRKTDYLPTFRLAREVGLENHLFARLTGCVQVQLNSSEAETSQTVNIGLNLRFNKRNEEVVGYSKRFKNKEGRYEWRFSRATVDAINDLFDKYGEFYDQLRRFMNMDKIPLNEVVGGEEYRDTLTTVREIAKYIKDQPFSKAPRQKSGGIVFDEGVVEVIQQVVEEHLNKPLNLVNLKVNAADLYIPGLHLGLFAPDPKAYFCLYDRIVNVRIDITIPLGLKGTVIGIHRSEDEDVDEREATYEILFDEEFATGSETRGAKGKRVAILSSVSMINISHGQRIMENKQQDDACSRRGHGAWTSPTETRVKVMSRSRKAQSPPKIPSSFGSKPVNTSPNKAEQKWFDPAWVKVEDSTSQANTKQQQKQNKNENQREKTNNNLSPKKNHNKKTTPKKEQIPAEQPNILQELLNGIEGVDVSQGFNDPAIVASSARLPPPAEGIPIRVEELFASFNIADMPSDQPKQQGNFGLPDSVPSVPDVRKKTPETFQQPQFQQYPGNNFQQRPRDQHYQHQQFQSVNQSLFHQHQQQLQYQHQQQQLHYQHQQQLQYQQQLLNYQLQQQQYQNPQQFDHLGVNRYYGGPPQGFDRHGNGYNDRQPRSNQNGNYRTQQDRRQQGPPAQSPFVPTQVMRMDNMNVPSERQNLPNATGNSTQGDDTTPISEVQVTRRTPQVRGPMWKEETNVAQNSKDERQPPKELSGSTDSDNPNQAVRKRVASGPRLGATFGAK